MIDLPAMKNYPLKYVFDLRQSCILIGLKYEMNFLHQQIVPFFYQEEKKIGQPLIVGGQPKTSLLTKSEKSIS